MPHPLSGIRGRLLALSLACTCLCAPAARACDTYFVLVFGSQRTPNEPNYSHSWATFVRVSYEEAPRRGCRFEAHTISWLPANLVVRTLALHAEPGHNFELHETVRYALGNDERVSMWGPYQIGADLYVRAMKQIALLESGAVQYKAIDSGHRTDRVSNCIHAVASVPDGYRVRAASPLWGETASYLITRRMMPFVVDDDPRKFRWVGSALGLDQYPIIYRENENPRSGTIRAAAQRALGIDRTPQATYGPPAP